MAVFRSRGIMPLVRDALMMFVMVGKRMSRFSQRSVVGMGSSSQDLADALLIIFKTNSSVTDSKISKGFPAKEVSRASSWVWRRIFFLLMLRIFSVKYSEKTFGRSSESNVEGRGEDPLLPRMVLKF